MAGPSSTSYASRNTSASATSWDGPCDDQLVGGLDGLSGTMTTYTYDGTPEDIQDWFGYTERAFRPSAHDRWGFILSTVLPTAYRGVKHPH